MMSSVRLQKLLAGGGHGSRRAIEEWIRAGRVTIGGRIARLGDRATPEDDIRLDGRRLPVAAAAPAASLLIYHKPAGEVTTRSDPQGRPTVFARLPAPPQGRWVAVGRLDVNTTGLLLFTNDGALAHALMHPSAQIEREYLVRVRGAVDETVIERLRAGVELEDGPARFERVIATRGEEAATSHSWFRVALKEGRNREVRRLWSAVGCEVSRLKRTRYGTLELPRELGPGTWRPGSPAEIAALAAAARVEPA